MKPSRTDTVNKKNTIHTLKIGLWFSWQELNTRRIVFFINIVLIALLVSIAVSMDFMGRARKSSIQDRIDYIGPSLSLVPKGIGSSDLVKAQLKGRTYPWKIYYDLQKDFSSLLRGAEARLIMNLPVGEKTVAVVGIDFNEFRSYPFSRFSLNNDEVLMGDITARKLKKITGDEIRILSRTFRIAAVIKTTGGIDDVSLFMSLPALQGLTGEKERINEIRLFPMSASSLDKMRVLLREHYSHIDIIDSYRGEVAEKDIDTTLGGYQKIVYSVVFILIALCIIISTYINLDERKSEIATIYTLGATKGIIFHVLTLRTVWIALLGSVAGQVLAFLATLLQDNYVPLQHVWSWNSFVLIVLGTVLLGLLVTTPFTIYSVFKTNMTSHL